MEPGMDFPRRRNIRAVCRTGGRKYIPTALQSHVDACLVSRRESAKECAFRARLSNRPSKALDMPKCEAKKMEAWTGIEPV